uniref:Uncharacterized protein n=1 Tax=Peromyscus maniculatus bairdii TaxID=230844 RepID=A0A8C8TBU0_PERMB
MIGSLKHSYVETLSFGSGYAQRCCQTRCWQGQISVPSQGLLSSGVHRCKAGCLGSKHPALHSGLGSWMRGKEPKLFID